MMKTKYPLFVLVGPSGVGKSTLIKAMLSMFPFLRKLVTATTRAPEVRDGAMEVDGVSYHFWGVLKFLWMILTRQMLEWVMNHGGYFYGMPWLSLKDLKRGPRIIDIDYRGARSIRSYYPDAVIVVVRPNSLTDLRERLTKGRANTRDNSVRLKTAEKEMAIIDKSKEFPIQIVNDDLGKAILELKAIIRQTLVDRGLLSRIHTDSFPDSLS